jgi:hypothetical protein
MDPTGAAVGLNMSLAKQVNWGEGAQDGRNERRVF